MLQGLKVGSGVLLNQLLVPAGQRQDVGAKHAEFSVDNDVASLIEPSFRADTKLGAAHGGNAHVSGNVYTGAENETKPGVGMRVGARQQAGTGIVQNSLKLNVQVLRMAGSLDDVAKVLANEALVSKESLAHTLKLSTAK